ETRSSCSTRLRLSTSTSSSSVRATSSSRWSTGTVVAPLSATRRSGPADGGTPSGAVRVLASRSAGRSPCTIQPPRRLPHPVAGPVAGRGLPVSPCRSRRLGSSPLPDSNLLRILAAEYLSGDIPVRSLEEGCRRGQAQGGQPARPGRAVPAAGEADAPL